VNLQDLINQAARVLPEFAPRQHDARPRPGSGLRAVLRLEIIGDDWYQYLYHRRRGEARENELLERKYDRLFGMGRRNQARPWVARLVGITLAGGFQREFLRGQKDYSQANSEGSRGVYEYFALREGVYEVFERTAWTRTRRYYVRVVEGTIAEAGEEEVVQCLRSEG
jgi:hypothetical protein